MLHKFDGALYLRRGNRVVVTTPNSGKFRDQRSFLLQALAWLITNDEAKELCKKVLDAYAEYRDRQQGIQRS